MGKKQLAKMVLVSLIATNVLYGGVHANAKDLLEETRLDVGTAAYFDEVELDNKIIQSGAITTKNGINRQFMNGATFTNCDIINNEHTADGPAGGALYFYTREKQQVVTINGGTLSNNFAKTNGTNKNSINSAPSGGAIFSKGAKLTLNDVNINNNYVDGNGGVAGGGALFIDAIKNTIDGTPTGTPVFYPSEVIINITKNNSYTGNEVKNAKEGNFYNTYGAIMQSGGGFMYLDRTASATFNIEKNTVLTIGDEASKADTNGYLDGIASSIPLNETDDIKHSVITKTGNGTMDMNGSMNHYYGTLDVEQGTMNINSDWTMYNDVSLNGGTLNLANIELDGLGGEIKYTNTNGQEGTTAITTIESNITTKEGTYLTAKNVTTKFQGSGIKAEGQFDISGDLTVNKDTSVEMLGGGSVAGTTNVNGTFTSKGVDFKGDINLDDGSKSTLNGTNLNSTGVFTAGNNAHVIFEDGNWVINKLTGDSANIRVGSDNKTPAAVTLNDNIATKNFTLKDGASLIINADSLSKPAEAAVTVNGGQTKIGDSSTIQVNDLKTGAQLKLFSDSTANQKAMGIAKSNNILQSFSQNGEYLEITAVDPKTVIGNAVITNVADYANKNNIESITDFLKLGSAEKTTTALNALANIGELGGTAHGAYSMSNALTDSVHEHLSKPQHGDESDIWAKYIHTKENIDGVQLGGMTADIDAQYNGIIAGGEFYNKGKASAGMAFMYADGSISSGSGAYTKNDAEYYGASLYGRIDNGDSALIGDISYLHGSNDITQYNAGHTITASPDADAFSIGMRAEQVFDTNAGTFTPYAGLRYMHLGIGDYTDSVGLSYDADEQNLFLLPVGVKYSTEIKNGGWTIRPLAEAGYVWTLGDRDTDQTVRLGSAADSFGFEVADSGSFLGKLGVEFDSDAASYGFGYEYQKGDTVKANRWMANMEFKF